MVLIHVTPVRIRLAVQVEIKKGERDKCVLPERDFRHAQTFAGAGIGLRVDGESYEQIPPQQPF